MTKLITCKVCEDGEPFTVPHDSIGIALLEVHFIIDHPEKYKEYLAWQADRSKNVDPQ